MSAVLEVGGLRLVAWGYDCIDCQGDYGVNDRCDSCGGTNRIPLYATAADAERFTAPQRPREGGNRAADHGAPGVAGSPAGHSPP